MTAAEDWRKFWPLVLVAAGTKLQIAGLLTSRCGGFKHFGKIFQMMAAMIAAGSGLGRLFASAIHDHCGSYTPFLICGIIASFVCGFLIYGPPQASDFSTPMTRPVA